jgi:tetratricopeptide (TPR) repeat protein
MKHVRLLAGVVAAIAVVGAAAYFQTNKRTTLEGPQTAVAKSPIYVGAATCATCHSAQVLAWRGSHHDSAMQHATAQSVLGNFDNVRYEYNGVTSTFSKRDSRFYINTDGPDGKLTDYEVRYTFGVAPLQQYLVEIPGGRMQAVSIAWDSRSQADGGQRWFHLYPKEKIDYKDELHWTKRSQNWNYMCAECHSTNVKKNYDAAADQFKTTWSELNVACESCHGPASQHVEWAKQSPRAEHDDRKGLVFLLNERAGASWMRNVDAKTASRNPPRTTTIEIDTCARCHSRRSTLTENYQHGKPLMDTHLPALLTAPWYHPDGQIKEEDFEYGSFLQSKMFHQGVTCSDCHEPHSLKLRAPGNQTCLQCHSANTYDTQKHHFHPLQSKGALCAECHMPTTNYMVVHARHDHSIRIPRPDLSIKLGTPNACNNCHANKNAAWAAAQMQKWYGKEWSDNWHFGETLFDAEQGAPKIGQDLVAVAASPQIADIARATAATLLPNYLDPTVGVVLPRLLADKSPLVRHAILTTVEVLPPPERLRLAGNLLFDPTLAVRIEAARVLSVVPRESLSLNQQQALDKALREYVDAALASAEHPQSHVNLGLLYLGQGLVEKAEQAYRQAIKLDPTYAAAYVNLADLYRQQQSESKAEATLIAARAAVGQDAGVEHSLGLQYVRAKQMPQALSALATAARLQPDNARYGYVYAVALDGAGESARAIKILQEVHAKHPFDRDVLIGLVGFNKARGNTKEAMGYARKLVAMDPRYGSSEQIMDQVSR